MSLPSLRLKANADRRLRAGHLWVYSNEVDVAATPLQGLKAGQQAILEAANGKPLGVVAMSPNNLICARLLSRDAKLPLDKSLLVHRLNVALSCASVCSTSPATAWSTAIPTCCRAWWWTASTTCWWSNWPRPPWSTQGRCDRRLGAGAQAQRHPVQNDSAARDAEGLERYVETVYGEVPDWVPLQENGVKFEAPVRDGQKTGWFYDHRMNRARLAPYVKGKRVLDLFSYIGGWGVQAGVFGASEVFCVDASGFALDGVERNAALNGISEADLHRRRRVRGPARAQGRRGTLRRDHRRPTRLHQTQEGPEKRRGCLSSPERASHAHAHQGWHLVSASCSMHLPEDDLHNILLTSARHLDRNLQLLERGGQGPDHPVHPAIPETRYIKSITCRLLPNS